MTLYIERTSKLKYRIMRRFNYYARCVYWSLRGATKSTPVFLLGSGRSGTDIVAHCVSKSWDVELVNEDNPKAFRNWRLKSLDVVSEIVKKSGAQVVLFKPIVETLRAREFLLHFPGASVIFVTRNPFDAINSMVDFFGNSHVSAVEGWVKNGFARQPQAPTSIRHFITKHCEGPLSPEDACALYWILYNSVYIGFALNTHPNVHLVSYDDLVENPKKTTQAVCKFIGLRWSSRMIKDVRSPTSRRRRTSPAMSPEIEKECLRIWGDINKTFI